MRKLFFVFILLACTSIGRAQVPGLGQSQITSSGPCLDKDGDHYGVGPGCLGPDADDDDPDVHSASDVLFKYGPDPLTGGSRPINNWLARLGYQTTLVSGSSVISLRKVWALSISTGSDSNNCSSTVSADSALAVPCQTWAHIVGSLAAGDIVVVRGGTYPRMALPSGTSGNPIVVIAYPGEVVTLSQTSASSGAVIDAAEQHYWVVDGLRVTDNCNGGVGISTGSYGGDASIQSHDWIIRRTEVSNSGTGGGNDSNIDGDNLHNVLLEYNVVHDVCAPGQHNIYLGSNNFNSDGVVIQFNITYNDLTTGGYPQIQFNGRCNQDGLGLPCHIDFNWIFSGNAGGITIEQGYANSFIEGNTCFNTGKCLTIFNYDSGQ